MRPTDSCNPATKPLAGKRKFDVAICVDNHVDLSEGDTSSSSSDYDKVLTKAGKSTKLSKPTPPTSPATMQVTSPVFTIYRDRRVDLAVQTGSIPEHLVHDIVRGTVSNMISMTLSDPWNRMPTTIELKEMAKSLVVTYPLLCDPVNGHVSQDGYISSIPVTSGIASLIIISKSVIFGSNLLIFFLKFEEY